MLLLNLGGPDSLDAVEPYLVNLFSDPFLIRLPLRGWPRRKFAQWVARKRAPHVRQLYSEIGGRSPIEPITRKQGAVLQAVLGDGYRCYVAFSAWTPYIRDAVASAQSDGCQRLVGVFGAMFGVYNRFAWGAVGMFGVFTLSFVLVTAERTSAAEYS